MPILDSRAPIVVGARHTSRATTLLRDTADPCPTISLTYREIGSSVAQTIRKMMVKVINRICKAISLGVFFRAAPSTMAIILSRKDAPLAAVTRSTIQSLTTVVPPVTALRSPPDSRITGALSPVIADSSTEAIPSITSPSIGIISPVFT